MDLKNSKKMSKVTAPYNFVPLNEKVFFLPWAEYVSHDVPFKNGLSGSIDIEITAESPIFIRGSEKRKGRDTIHYFHKKGNRYFIPGSSIRNMLRSVFEILSFSKMSTDSFRDKKNKNTKHHISEGVKNIQKNYNNEKLDLTQIVFGTIDNKAIKSRISVAHAFSQNATELSKVIKVLGTPKASYYPFYIEQEGGKKVNISSYHTYNDKDFKIHGRKRYPLHKLDDKSLPRPNNVSTTFKPLKEGATFNTSIKFHNLLPEELGALLSTITFHNHSVCRHNIGLAKPFGYGQIKIDILNLNINSEDKKESLENYMFTFQELMQNWDKNWISSPQLLELITMSSINAKEMFNQYDYMPIKNFSKIKSEKKALPYYSNFINYKETIKEVKEKSINSSIIVGFKFKAIEKINQITQKIELLKKQAEIESLSYREISLNDEIEVIYSENKKATLNIDNEIISVQFIIPKGTLFKAKRGDVLKVTVQQKAKPPKKTLQVKLKQ